MQAVLRPYETAVFNWVGQPSWSRIYPRMEPTEIPKLQLDTAGPGPLEAWARIPGAETRAQGPGPEARRTVPDLGPASQAQKRNGGARTYLAFMAVETRFFPLGLSHWPCDKRTAMALPSLPPP